MPFYLRKNTQRLSTSTIKWVQTIVMIPKIFSVRLTTRIVGAKLSKMFNFWPYNHFFVNFQTSICQLFFVAIVLYKIPRMQHECGQMRIQGDYDYWWLLTWLIYENRVGCICILHKIVNTLQLDRDIYFYLNVYSKCPNPIDIAIRRQKSGEISQLIIIRCKCKSPHFLHPIAIIWMEIVRSFLLHIINL